MRTNRTPSLFPWASRARCAQSRLPDAHRSLLVHGLFERYLWDGLTSGNPSGHSGFVRPDTSFGEASSRTQATDPNRRETLRIRTPLPGPRGEAKWLRSIATPWSAKALTREVASPAAARAALGRAPTKGGVRWTVIVRAEVGPLPPLSLVVQAHVDVTDFPFFCPRVCPGLPRRVPQSRLSAKRERGDPNDCC